MKRRTLIVGLGSLAALQSMPLTAQQTERRPIVAFLSPGPPDYTDQQSPSSSGASPNSAM